MPHRTQAKVSAPAIWRAAMVRGGVQVRDEPGAATAGTSKTTLTTTDVAVIARVTELVAAAAVEAANATADLK